MSFPSSRIRYPTTDNSNSGLSYSPRRPFPPRPRSPSAVAAASAPVDAAAVDAGAWTGADLPSLEALVEACPGALAEDSSNSSSI